MRKKKLFRSIFRFVILLLALFLVIGGPLPEALNRIVPGLSPFALMSTNLAGRWWFQGLFWGLPLLLVLLPALLKGRFFCKWFCPTGTVYGMAAWLGSKHRRKLLKVKLNGVLFWSTLTSALVGIPLFLFADPLSTFNRSVITWTEGLYLGVSIIPGLLVPAFILLGIFQPYLWCTQFCPLGYLFDLIHIKRKQPLIKQSITRRDVLQGLGVGLVGTFVFRHLPLNAMKKTSQFPVLPPGAVSLSRFSSLCSRCFNCIERCPENMIKTQPPKLGQPLSTAFHPYLDTSNSVCEQYCKACTEVCPTGAIKRFTMEEKQSCKIGTAVVTKEACISWERDEHCMACQEHCPYLAIDSDQSSSGVNRPVVVPDICRGCGACEKSCPAKPNKAIVVHGIPEQVTARDLF